MRAGAFAATLLAGLALAGCERDGKAPAAPVAEARAGTPLTFALSSADAEVKLALPAALAAHPTLHRTLYDNETRAMKAFMAEAGPQQAEYGAAMPPFAMEVTWRVAAETPRLLSLVRESYDFAGGAHGNSASMTLLFDKVAGREVAPATLFPAEASLPRLEGTLCNALKRVKAEAGAVPLDGETWSCPKWRDSQAALAPVAGGRATGLTFLFSPYEVGPYAEGGFEVTLPATEFRADIAPAYRDQFVAD